MFTHVPSRSLATTPFKQPLALRLFHLLTERPLILLALLLLVSILLPDVAHASSTGMPWESPLSKLVSSITGPVAFAVSILSIVAAVGGLLFGGELSGLIKTMIFLAMGIGIVVFAANVLKGLFNVSSTLIL